MRPSIRFDHVSKKFLMATQRARTLQELFLDLVHRRKRERELLWILRDVSFEIGVGETVGLIGENGAGKSSVLKLMSRILSPTSGRIEINGRVGALLELGAGFHPDLTGRENIYLNGAVLGLDRAYIRRQLDEIIAFSELDRFIDMPVKHYSSGMYMRLGFSITVQLQPEILLVDEILAVGDHVFQQKCMKRIRQLKDGGLTIVLVSHNLDHIWQLCDRVIWLADGRVEADGPVASVADQYLTFANKRYLRQYLADQEAKGKRGEQVERRRWGTQQAQITQVEFLGSDPENAHRFRFGHSFRVRVHYEAYERIEWPAFGLAIYRKDGTHLSGPNSRREGCEIPHIEGPGFIEFAVDALTLNSGFYELTVAIYNREATTALDHHHRLYEFEVLPATTWREEGFFHLPGRWNHHRSDAPAVPEPERASNRVL